MAKVPQCIFFVSPIHKESSGYIKPLGQTAERIGTRLTEPGSPDELRCANPSLFSCSFRCICRLWVVNSEELCGTSFGQGDDQIRGKRRDRKKNDREHLLALSESASASVGGVATVGLRGGSDAVVTE